MTIPNCEVAKHWARGDDVIVGSQNLTVDRNLLRSYNAVIGFRYDDYALIDTHYHSMPPSRHQREGRYAARQAKLRAVSLDFLMLQTAFGRPYQNGEPALLDLRELNWPKRQSSLFRLDGKYYLFSHDGDSWRFHREFGVLLPYPCENVGQAFDMLKPLVVQEAELNGIEVKRQGEWFFIPVAEPHSLRTFRRWYELRANDSARPHKVTRADVSKITGEVFAKGTVRHEEHSMLRLGDTWHEVAQNTAVESYSPGFRGID